MFYYIMIFLAAIGCAVSFVFTKVYQLEQGNGTEKGILFNCLLGLTGAAIYFAVCGFRIEITIFSVVMASLLTLFAGLYTIIGFKIMSLGSMAVYTVFLMLGGMILPYFYGLIFLGEEITAVKVIALFMMTVAIILQKNSDKKRGSVLFYILCCAVFILNGMVSIVSKVHQINGNKAVSANEFVFWQNLMKFILFGAMLFFVKKERKNTFGLNIKSYMAIIASAITGSVSYMLQLICASHIPATVQFPAMSGGAIVFSALLGLIFFKETLERKQIAGIVICAVSTIVFVL